jgi:molybdate transport system substrate-binding protein
MAFFKHNIIKHIVFVSMILIFSLLVVGCQKNSSKTPETITISAAASLKGSMDKLKELYKKEKPNVELVINFGSSGDLQQQIENGAPVDIFLSAGEKQMNALLKKDLILDNKSQNLLGNTLVLITPKDKTNVKTFDDLLTDKVKQIALGDSKSVPAGQYAEEMFKNLNCLDAIKAKAIYAKDVKQVLIYVEGGEVDAGVVYSTDAKASDKVNVVATAPKDSHAPILYSVAVIKASTHTAKAKEFIDFLYSDKAKAVFEDTGFTSLSK